MSIAKAKAKKMTKAQRWALIVKLAQEQYDDEGTIEVDDGAKVSEVPLAKGGDHGAYVQAWVWVDFANTPLCQAHTKTSSAYCGYPACPGDPDLTP